MDINNICLQFSKNSWHRRLNQYVYGKRYFIEPDWSIIDNKTMFSDWVLAHQHDSPVGYPMMERKICLCPYFWGTMSAIIVSPISYASKHWPDIHIHNPIQLTSDQELNLLKGIGWIVLGTALVSFAYYTVAIDWMPAAILGAVAGVVAPVSAGVIYGIPWLDEHWPEWLHLPKRKSNPKKANMFIEFIKANKKKVCPCIEWD